MNGTNRLVATARCATVAILLSFALAPSTRAAPIPATPLMTVYRFDGPLRVPYYDVNRFLRDGPSAPAGTLAQGTSVIPCLVIRGGKAVTDGSGTPYVGFRIVVDASLATPASAARFEEVSAQRKAMVVDDHRCPVRTSRVIDVRNLYALDKPPRFDPPPQNATSAGRSGRDELDRIIRTFHVSRRCEAANRRLVDRRDALRNAWTAFIADNAGRWAADALARARHLDFVMRTVLYEGHLGRGCSAYGACERDVIALSIRNRALERCLAGQGCTTRGDFEGVASTVSQYNIWDEYLAQTSGLTSCFLRPDLARHEHYARLQAMYEQSVGDVERILFGDAGDLQDLFPGESLAELTQMRNYYHPPAMGKCFPHRRRLEYISGAVARRGDRFALIANARISVGERRGGGYLFRQAVVDAEPDRDVVRLFDRYPGFVIDGRKVELKPPSRCTAYGTPPGCRFAAVGRHRKTPSWLASGHPTQITCRVRSRGEDCTGQATLEKTKVGGVCDTRMQPFAGVP